MTSNIENHLKIKHMCVKIKGERPNEWKNRYLKYEYSGITFQDHRKKSVEKQSINISINRFLRVLTDTI